MDANIAIAQACGLRRVAADLDRVWDDYLQGNRTDDDEESSGEEFLGSMLAAPVVRALAAELALKAITIMTTGALKLGHDLLKLFDALDQKTQTAIEQQRKDVVERAVHGCAVYPRQAQERFHRFAPCRGDAARLEADVCVRG